MRLYTKITGAIVGAGAVVTLAYGVVQWAVGISQANTWDHELEASVRPVKDQLIVAQAQLKASCDATIKRINREIGRLEAIPEERRTPREREELKRQHEDLEYWTAICRGK